MTQQHKNLQSSPYPHQGIDRDSSITQLETLDCSGREVK
jgi:hypothetical protein